MEGFELAMDGISATHNICKAALDIRYRSQVLSRDEEHVVLMVPVAEWLAMDDHIEMFVAFCAMDEEREQQIAQDKPQGEQQ